MPRKSSSSRSRERKRRFLQRSARHKPGMVHNIPSFCKNNDISQTTYFSLKRKGRGPREIELDGRIIITPEAEADWRREREAETAAKREADARHNEMLKKRHAEYQAKQQAAGTNTAAI
jgi:hypothetical protein